MSGQGYHFAICREQADSLLACAAEEEVLRIVDALYDTMDDDEANTAGGYKEWDVLHRLLSDGTFDPNGGAYPFNRCFFGGRLLVREGTIVNLVLAEEVADVAAALERLDRQWFGERFSIVFACEYEGEHGALAADVDRFWQIFYDLRQFYRRAADRGYAVLFYTDDSLDYFLPENARLERKPWEPPTNG